MRKRPLTRSARGVYFPVCALKRFVTYMATVEPTLLEIVRARRELPAPAMCRAIRQQAGLSLAPVARELDVARMTISGWERGTRRPRGRNLVAYVKLLKQLREVTEAAA